MVWTTALRYPDLARRLHRLSSRGRRARRLSSRFQHRWPNRTDPLERSASLFRGAWTLLRDRCLSFHRPWSFSNNRISRDSAVDIRFARFRGLRSRSLVRAFRSARPSGSHFFKRKRSRRRLLLARLGFSWLRRRRLEGQFLGRLDCLLWSFRWLPQRFGLFFASNDYFLRMYVPDNNHAAE